MQIPITNVKNIIFGDQFRTMAVYGIDDTVNPPKKKVLEYFVLRDRQSGTSVPQYYKMRIDPTTTPVYLTINEVTGEHIPPEDSPNWRDFDFSATNGANDIWLDKDDNSVIIGIGDIRGGLMSRFAYDLKAYDVFITSFGSYTLRLHK